MAHEYAELGYNVLPCVPNGKAPLTSHGLKDATDDSFQIELWFVDHADANLAIALPATVIVIDRDVDPETGKINPEWPGSPERELDLMAGPVAKTPRGGSHHWFKLPAGFACKNSTSDLAKHVDVKTGGGYVLVSPSTIDGKRYSWLDTNTLDCGPSKLPPAPQWLLEQLTERPDVPRVSDSNAAEPIPEGQRNATLFSKACAYRRIGADEEQLFSMLSIENRKRCNPPLPETEIRTIARSSAKYEPDQVASLLAEEGNSTPVIVDPGHLPKRLINVPGLIRDFMDYTIRGATRPQPEVTLAAAIALMGVLTGRKIKGATGLRTNAMTIALCGTGGGKERPRQALKETIYAAGLGHLIPMEEIASSAALLNAVAEQPACLFPIDEFGKFLRTTKDSANNPHVADIVGLLMKFFSQAGQTYAGRGHADTSKKKSIVNPHVCLFGTSVRQSVLEGLTEENLTDGFVSRLLIFEASCDNPDAVRRPCIDPPPPSLIDQVEWWGRYAPPVPPSTGNIAAAMSCFPRLIADGPGVEDLLFEADNQFRSYQDPDQVGSAIWTRGYEKARTLSLIYQCSADRESEFVTMEAAEWALALVEHLTRRIVLLANEWIADNRQGRLVNKIVRKLREKGGEMPAHAITKLLQKVAQAKEVHEILSTLELSGTLSKEVRQTNGRTGVFYRLSA